ncbi:DUF2304 domain-containing protein [Actinotalea sp. AC32]|nr:DUF2304 domain-containing protein [Actinotalea sp. AC32]
MLIKVLLLAAIALVVVLGMRAPSGARHLAMRRMALAGFALFAALSVVFPDAWNEAAEVVGVGRGTDLLLYGLIIAFLLSLVTMYRRHREMERRLTLLARRLAIDEAIGRFPPNAPAAPSVPPTPPTTTGDDRA